MAYVTSNPPRLITQGIIGGKLWYYESADPIATVNTDAYFSNGYALGMRNGDTVIVRDTATPTTSLATVNGASATTGAVDITDGTAITQTDSD